MPRAASPLHAKLVRAKPILTFFSVVIAVCAGCEAAPRPPSKVATVATSKPPASPTAVPLEPDQPVVPPAPADDGVARKVCDLWSTLAPIVSGGWQGSPIKIDDPPPLPDGWNGLAVEYQRGPGADEPWYRERDGQRELNEDRRRVLRTFLLWHAPTEEGIILNPVARDTAYVVEIARAQPKVRWKFVIDTVSQVSASPKLPGKEWGRWRDQVAYKGARVPLRDYERPWREQRETVAAEPVAKALGAEVIALGANQPRALAADKLLVYRSYMDPPHDRTLRVEWGPFEMASDWKD